ncbi:D-alanyl-D-alanine carboxypeptidase [Candidatus Parcubacteria bacterium]|nr:D-alanyl-D-alanine carboxypeptidase [Candidatus Parcubacteria bacterium]
MNIPDLQKLALRTRSTREAGITLLLASAVLALFLLISPVVKRTPSAAVTIHNPSAPNAFANVSIEAKAAVVYDIATRKILYAKNAEAQLPLASLTKLLTVYAALKELSPNTPITIPESAAGVYPPHAFTVGQVLPLADLARLTLTGSLNDGAIAIANATAIQENKTVTAMLAGAAGALDLSQTYALNGSGLDVNTVISGGYGSAADLARLAGALFERAPNIVSATTHHTAHYVLANGTSFTIKNTDPIVSTIPRLLLSKTGYTDLAGGNLALVFDVGMGHPIAVIVLGSTLKSRFTDGAALVDATLAHFAGIASL